MTVVAMTFTAAAATVYDKDGTTLVPDGPIQAAMMNGNLSKATGDKDHHLKNSAHFSLSGRTKLTYRSSAFPSAEGDKSDRRNSNNNVTAHEQYVGADFGV